MPLLDVKGLLCPLPVLKTRKALERLEPGASLVVEATDPAAAIDMPHFCAEAGHDLVSQEAEGGVLRFEIRKRESG